MKRNNLFALSIFWFAWELHWSALLGAALQGQISRFAAPDAIGRATALLAGSGALFSIIAQYGAGRTSDRLGRRMPFIIAGTLLDVVALFGFALSPSFVVVILAYAGVQISLNIACGPYQALMPDRVPVSARGRASAVMGLFRLSGTALGLIVAKIFVRQPGPGVSEAIFTHGLTQLATVIAIVLVVALLVTVIGVTDQGPTDAGEGHGIGPWPGRASFIWLIASRAAVNMGLYLIVPFLAFYLRFVHHVQRYLGMSLELLLFMTLCSLIGTVPAGIAGDRMPKKTILFVALASLTVGAASLSVLSQQSGLVPIAVLLGVGWGAYYSVDWALACVLLPPRRAGALMAVWNIGASGPQVLAPIVGGLLVDKANALSGGFEVGYRLLFAVVAVFVIAGAAGLSFVHEPRAGLAQETG